MSTKLPVTRVVVCLLAATLSLVALSAGGCSSSDNGTGGTDASADSTSSTVDGGGGGGDADATACQGSKKSCNGSCVDTQTDPKNCGTCGATCGGGLVCSSGTCAVSCSNGQTLCGAGTCTDLQTDFDNCGKCGTACQPGQVCSSGSCSLFCNAPNKTCGSACVNVTTDPSNCGDCGKACASGQVCVGGSCAYSCGQLTTCTTDGGAFCTNTQTDNTNCGKCGTVCPAGQVCSQGSCQVSCQAGLLDCGGHCIDPQTDNQNCGATGACGSGGGTTGTQCNAGQQCTGGSCSVSCPPGEVACNNLCIDPKSNNQFCGATAGCGVGGTGSAGSACSTGKVCSGGSCQANCGQGLVLCTVGGQATCVDPTSNASYCGASGDCTGANAGKACGAGTVCAGGVCQASCLPGTILCSTKCVDPNNDPIYCGASGNCQGVNAGQQCQNGHVCSGGNCLLSCANTQANCNNQCIDPKSSTQFCGANIPDCSPSGQDCTSVAQGFGPGYVCSGGATPHCILQCQNGLIDCNNTCIDPTTSPKYCGATGTCTGASVGQDCTSAAQGFGTGYVCSGGGTPHCVLSCQSGLVNCVENSQQTCINPLSDPLHCGASGDCSSGSNPGSDCTSAAQGFGPGYVCNNGHCTLSCQSNLVKCSENGQVTCIDPKTDSLHCGASGDCTTGSNGGQVCASGFTCINGSCTLTCQSGLIDCNNTCVDPTTNPAYCGAKGNCTNDGQSGDSAGQNCTQSPYGAGYICSGGNNPVCQLVCQTGLVDCNNQCIDPNTSPFFCGAAGNCTTSDAGANSPGEDCTKAPFGSGYVCNSSTSPAQCSLTCQANLLKCPAGPGGALVCTDPKTSSGFCGASGNCTNDGQGGDSAGTACTGGTACCPSGATGACVDTKSDTNNCGSCGHICGLNQFCNSGHCTSIPTQCSAGNGTTGYQAITLDDHLFTNGSGSDCDALGNKWYRITGATNELYAGADPGGAHCSTSTFSGWLSTPTPPTQLYVPTSGTECFSDTSGGGGVNCLFGEQINIINCNGFYVYQLPNLASCGTYCTVNSQY